MVSDDRKLIIYGMTDVGQIREHNEDSIAWDSEKGLILLADGMGGHNAGEVASSIAIDTISNAMNDLLVPEIEAADVVSFKDALHEAMMFANGEIYEQAQEDPDCAGMGTTVVAALFVGKTVILGNVGDSRIYRMREGEFIQSTKDHSLVQEMVENGYLSEEEAQLSVGRNLITRALGIAPEVDADVLEDETLAGDLYLLCSDGLTDLVTDDEILAILTKHQYDLESAVQALVDAANEKGGKDNISVVLVSIQEAFSDDRGIDDVAGAKD